MNRSTTMGRLALVCISVIFTAFLWVAGSQKTKAAEVNLPYIEGMSISSWDDVYNEICCRVSAGSESTLKINLNGSTIIYGDVISKIAGSQMSLIFDLGNGVLWTIHGEDVHDPYIDDIDLGATLGDNSIPAALVRQVSEDKEHLGFSINHQGDLGFTGHISVMIDPEKCGQYANLYYYDEEKDDLELIGSGLIDKDGYAQLELSASDESAIVVDEASATSIEEAMVPLAGPKHSMSFYVGISIVMMCILTIFSVIGIVRRKMLSID